MNILTLDEIKTLYPDEWVLLGNPTIENTKVLSGIVLYHSKDKKELCYLGKPLTDGYEKVTLTFTGQAAPVRRIGIMKRL